MNRKIFGGLIPFDLEMDEEEFRRKASTISLELLSIGELRDARGILSQQSIEMDNRNPNLKYYVQLMYLLSAEERRRPISEQFPFTRCDIDILLKATENLEKSTSRLERSSKDKSIEMEAEVRREFFDELNKTGWDAVMMIEIIRGEILSIDIPSRVLVEWDGIIHATHEDSGISKVFFIETKEIADEKDIFREGEGLFDRSKRTYDYLQLLKMKTTDRISNSEMSKTQRAAFRALEDYEPTFVYASGNVDEKTNLNVLSAEKKSEDINYPIKLWIATCPRLTEINFTKSEAERVRYVTTRDNN